jgi:hypothetical protein
MSKIQLSKLEFQPAFFTGVNLDVAHVSIDGKEPGPWVVCHDGGSAEPIDKAVEHIKAGKQGRGFSIDTEDIARLARSTYITFADVFRDDHYLGNTSWIKERRRSVRHSETGWITTRSEEHREKVKGYWHIKMLKLRDDVTLVHEFVHIASMLALDLEYKFVANRKLSRGDGQFTAAVKKLSVPFCGYNEDNEFELEHKFVALLTSVVLSAEPNIAQRIRQESVNGWIRRLEKYPEMLEPKNLESWRQEISSYLSDRLASYDGVPNLEKYTLDEDSSSNLRSGSSLKPHSFSFLKGGLLYSYYFWEHLMFELEKRKQTAGVKR